MTKGQTNIAATSTQLPRLSIDEMTTTRWPEVAAPPVQMAGVGWGECGNLTGETLLVYGPPEAGSKYDTSLYCLPSGYMTPANWDCDGFFVPSDRIANQLLSKIAGPLAIKYRDLFTFIIEKSSPVEYKCYLNHGAYTPGDGLNWPIPNVPYSAIAQVCT